MKNSSDANLSHDIIVCIVCAKCTEASLIFDYFVMFVFSEEKIESSA